jgi:hypothetical protein
MNWQQRTAMRALIAIQPGRTDFGRLAVNQFSMTLVTVCIAIYRTVK